MANHLLIFGLGYTSGHLASALRDEGWKVTGTRRTADGENIGFDDKAAIEDVLARATHILSSVPPAREGGDPVLDSYGDAIEAASANWIGYLSSTGVYGDTQGAWVDETALLLGRRPARNAADLAWQKLRKDIRIFRLPGIYGPGRSALDRVRQGKAHRIDLPDQIFSRVHVDDIIGGIVKSFDGPAGVFNLSDDYPCGQNAVIEQAAQLLDVSPPAMQSLEQAGLSPAARAFYAESRRVSNEKARRILGWEPVFPTYKQGLRTIYTSD